MASYRIIAASGSYLNTPFNALAHYGVPNMHWHVRRYQDENGHLTELGKARLAKKAGEYLPDNPKQLNSTVKFDKNGNIKSGGNRKRLAEEYSEDDRKRTYSESMEKYNKLKTKWASATLKDLGLKDTSAARRDVKAVLKDIDPGYNYKNRHPYYDSDTLSNTQLKEFMKRKNILMHPIRTKVKNGAKKTKEVLDVVSTAKKLLSLG